MAKTPYPAARDKLFLQANANRSFNNALSAQQAAQARIAAPMVVAIHVGIVVLVQSAATLACANVFRSAMGRIAAPMVVVACVAPAPVEVFVPWVSAFVCLSALTSSAEAMVAEGSAAPVRRTSVALSKILAHPTTNPIARGSSVAPTVVAANAVFVPVALSVMIAASAPASAYPIAMVRNVAATAVAALAAAVGRVTTVITAPALKRL